MQPNQLVSDAYLAYQNTHHVHEEFLCSREIAKSSKNEIIEVFETFNPFLQAFKKTVGTPSGLAYKRYEEQLRQAEKNVHDAQQQKEAAKKELMKALTLQVANQDPLIIEAGLLIVALEDIGRQIREIVECIPGLQKQLKSDMKFEFFDLITTNTTAVGLVGMLGSYMKSGKSIKYLEAFARQNEDLHRKREIMHDKLKSFYELISQHEQFDEFKEIDLPEVKGGKLINAIEGLADITGILPKGGGLLSGIKIFTTHKQFNALDTTDAQLRAMYDGIETMYDKIMSRQQSYLQTYLDQLYPETKIRLID